MYFFLDTNKTYVFNLFPGFLPPAMPPTRILSGLEDDYIEVMSRRGQSRSP